MARENPSWAEGRIADELSVSGIVACDFFTSVTVTFQVLYVFVAIEIGSRRLCTATSQIIRLPSGPGSSSVNSWTENPAVDISFTTVTASSWTRLMRH